MRPLALLVLLTACGRFGFDAGASGNAGDGGVSDGGDGGTSARVMIEITGDGAVEVAGRWCALSCMHDVPIGTVLAMQAVPRDGSIVTSNSFACPNAACTLEADLQIAVAFAPGPITANRIFVTATGIAGPVGGLSGADAFCVQRANVGGFAGTFIALLPSSATTAVARLGNSRGWVRPDGVAVFDRPADVYRQQINAISVDELGDTPPGNTNVLGGATDDGAVFTNRTCTDWTVATGTAEVRGPLFSGGTVSTTSGGLCSQANRVVCAEIGKQVTVSPVAWPFGRYIFKARTLFVTSNGIANADATCAGEAQTAGLAGTYRALLATDGASVASRFSSLDGPWRRPDGVRVARGDLAVQTELEAPINRDASGAPVTTTGLTFLGARSLTTAGTAATTCNGWSTTAAQVSMARAFDGRAWLPSSEFPCSNQASVLCAQE